MSWRERKKAKTAAVQLREGAKHPFGELGSYVPQDGGQMGMYRAIREAVPLVDAAVGKLVRLCGGVQVRSAQGQEELSEFLSQVPVGKGQEGIQAFLDCYLDSMLVCGRGVGEMVVDPESGEINALLCADPAKVEVREGEDPLEVKLCLRRSDGKVEELPRQDLLLFTPFQPEADHPYGVSMLRSMPFMTEILLKIYQATGLNWERMGNARFAVVYKPGPGEGPWARERGQEIASAWSQAMHSGREGTVRDFVAVGDVDIKVIGGDNQVLDAQVPVRQIMEQLVAKTGIPPFLLGLSWSSTERMSEQQADMMTSEITALRRYLTPVVRKVCQTWLRLHGFSTAVKVEWEDITLQDMVEEARAELYHEQAETLRAERRKAEES